MKNKVVLTLILTFVFMLFQTTEARQSVQQFKLQPNKEKKVFNKLTVKFVSVLEDSRCPADTTCVWAGNAKIQIKVRKAKGEWKTFELETMHADKGAEFAGYEIKFTDLKPVPRSNIRIDRNGYTATFVVRRL